MKLKLLWLLALLLTACASIDNGAEAAKLEAAGQTYRQCLVGRMLSKQANVDLFCRSARIGLLHAVMADPRRYEKSSVFEALAENAIESARADVDLVKDAATGRSTR
jgi:hypothetical protein